jgi:hypothetical protein
MEETTFKFLETDKLAALWKYLFCKKRIKKYPK